MGPEENKINLGVRTEGTGKAVNHPDHYNQGHEAIGYIESHGMNFNLGNVIKYVTRAKHKGHEIEDLQKAQWYLEREIQRLQKQEVTKKDAQNAMSSLLHSPLIEDNKYNSHLRTILNLFESVFGDM